MPTRKPRRPKRLPSGGPGARSFTDSGEADLSAGKLERIEEARRRRANAPPLHVARSAPSQRARRVVSADDFFGGWPEPVGTAAHETAEDDQLALFGAETDAWHQPMLGEDAPAASPSSTEYYSPTKSINPGRPRTLEMIYDRQTDVLRVVYRDGGTYDYFGVPGPIWYRIRKVQSPGRFINRNIKGNFEFERVAL